MQDDVSSLSGQETANASDRKEERRRQNSREFGMYFITVLILACVLFYMLQITRLPFLRDVGHGWLEMVCMALLPSIIAILAVVIGGIRYVRLEDQRVTAANSVAPEKAPETPGQGEADKSGENNAMQSHTITQFVVGDSCYYMGFLLTLWGLFLELLTLGNHMRDGSVGVLHSGLVGELVAGNGLALLSTIVGLVSRFILHRFFPEPSGTADSADRLLNSFDRYAARTESGQEKVTASVGTLPRMLDSLRDHAATFASFRFDWAARATARSEAEMAGVRTGCSAGHGGTHAATPSVPPPATTIEINTHYLSADVETESGTVHVGNLRDDGSVAEVLRELQKENESLRGRIEELERFHDNRQKF